MAADETTLTSPGADAATAAEPAGAAAAGGAATAGPARLGELVALVPAGIVLAGWLAWIPADGGYFPRAWYPGAVLAAALLGVVLLAGSGRRLGRPAALALGLLVAWVAVNALSILWAGSPGSALASTSKLVLYAASAAILALTPWRPASAAAFLGIWSVGTAVFLGADLLAAGRATDLGDVLIEERYVGPLGYANGTAALAAMAFWTGLVLSARPWVPRPLRPVLLAAAVLSLTYGLLPQSRAGMLALLVVAPLVVALGRHRVRLLARLAVAGGLVALSAVDLFEVYTAAAEGRPVGPALDAAARAVGLATVLAFGAGVVLALVEDRPRLGPRALRGLRLAGVAASVALLVGGAGLALANRGEVGDRLQAQWDGFTADEQVEKPTGPRFGTIFRDQRYDMWRVALDLYREAPVRGVGAGNFDRRYTAARSVPKYSRFTHDVWLRALSETGLVGLVLLVGAVLAALGALVLCAIRARPAVAGLAAIPFAVLAGFAVHASFDWLDELPAVAGPAFGLPFVVLGAWAAGRGRPGRGGRRVRLAAGVAMLLLAAALVAPWLSVRYVEQARARAATDPRGAAVDLDRARALNPLAPQPDFTAGAIALARDDLDAARRAYEDALEVEEHWLPHFELGLIHAAQGRFGRAARELAAARRINPLDPLVAEAQEAVRRRERIEPRAFNARALEQPVFVNRG